MYNKKNTHSGSFGTHPTRIKYNNNIKWYKTDILMRKSHIPMKSVSK